jgi:hypothetical protein
VRLETLQRTLVAAGLAEGEELGSNLLLICRPRLALREEPDSNRLVENTIKFRSIACEINLRGDALSETVAAGGVHLVKPSLGEFEDLIGRSLPEKTAQEAAARP